MPHTFSKAARMAQTIKDTDKPFYIDDNVGITVLTNSPAGKKIIGFEVQWKKEPPERFMVSKFNTILRAFKAAEKFVNDKK